MKNLFVLIFALTIATPAFAYINMGSYDAGAINSMYMQDIRNFARQKEIPKILQDNKEQQGFVLERVNFVNNHAFTFSELEQVFEKKLGTTVTPVDINTMRRELMQFYQKNGYPSVLVNIDSQDPDGGIVTYSINEGNKNSVQIEIEPLR
ncbi:MAG: POTRA domain-containing protein [Candidatus Gastranaerophilales bacterium]|nr:POTRA domain-containing protein [Candidatus Gastranaerophilales bacterium]